MAVMPDFVTSDGPDDPLDGDAAGPFGGRSSGGSNPDDDLDTEAIEAGSRAGHTEPSSFALTASPATPWPVSGPSCPFRGGWHGSAEDR